MPAQEQPQSEETNEQLNELKEKHKLSLLKNFSNLIKFICGLLELARPGCEINPIRVEFIHLISNTRRKSKNNYLKFICNCVKYCNQLDLISKQPDTQQQDDLLKAKELIQECLFKLVETLVRFTPDLLVRNFKNEMFVYEDASTSEFNEHDEQILDLIQKCLLDHLSTTRLESIKISSSVLSSLILLSKHFKIYLSKMSHADTRILLNPILKNYLIDNTFSWSSFIRELDKSFRSDSSEYVDLLSKFFIYVNLLLENVIVDKRFYTTTSRRLRDLFEWHNSKFNIKGLQIDTIPISRSLNKNRPSNENSLDNLLILIANVERSNSLDLDEKIEFCSNQTKRIVNILNDVAISCQDIKLERKFQLELVDDLGTSMSACEFGDYFMKRAVFSSKFSQRDLEKYETEWFSSDTSNNAEKTSDDLVEFDLDANVKHLFKSDLEFSSALVLDHSLNKQLNQNLDPTYLEELFCEHIDSIVENKLDRQENLIDADSMLSVSSSSVVKSKNADIIRFFNESYRKYKAPMRGGHSNPVSRHLTAPTLVSISNNNNSNNNSINSNLIAPPNLVNNLNSLNNLLTPSAMILKTATSQIARHDSFRARAPNTSRPASLHVDEYYRLQNANKQQNHVK